MRRPRSQPVQPRPDSEGWVTFEALCELLDLEQACAVRRWLEERGIPYLTRPDGRPVTRAAVVDAVLLRGASFTTRPDFSGLGGDDETAA